MTDFATLTLSREYPCPPGRLFVLLTNPEARAIWGAPSDDVVIEIDEADIRPGGSEVARCGPKDNPEFDVVAQFHAIEPDTRMVLTETLTVGGEMLSVSLVTTDLEATGTGTELTVTLQVASLSGPETAAGYQEGWEGALANLARLVGSEVAA
ncbi:SRPBCC family protein [Histidinibacterium aquaticum]|uniref:Activator of Hsp90 ATPase homologue 1/2-like C-terminal domain-containing protein n=1 Tax=Histidinibacterium aquaticum TaxID=2613962 RepID=A0A5J5GQV3_9RHOB|nr:SRPBCC family protein [Histidinibacterium aquaticum]KAA9010427.1 hypothetical protein F3S47_04070 [Histidinibacterium aquaticum]